MPNIVMPLVSVSQSVSRPVYIDMIQQIQKLTNIDPRTKIFYPGDSQKMQTPGASIDSKDEDRFAMFNSERYTFIEIEDDFDMDRLGSTAVEAEEHSPIFVDSKLGVYIKPVYASTDVTINFNYRCPSESEAKRWRDEVRVRVSKLMELNMHKVSYHYQIPINAIIILQEIHSKREANLPYGQDFVEYVTSHADPRLTLTGNVAGQDQALAIAETQTEIQGMFTWDGMPEKAQKDQGTGTWSVSFSYKFSFEKPIELHVRYPVMVHNQLLHEDFIEFTDKGYDAEKDNRVFSKSAYALNAFRMTTIMANRSEREFMIRIPSYDDFIIPDVVKGTGSVFNALVEIGSDKRSILNLTELGDYVIDEDILHFIKNSEYRYIGDYFRSILNLSLYRNNYLTGSGMLSCDANLNVSSNIDLDLRNQHRLRLGICVDITLLDPRALQRLQAYPKAMVKIIGAMNELLRNNPDFINLGNKPVISNHDLSAVTSFLTGYRIPIGTGNYYGNGIDNRDLFAGIDPRVVENYRRNMVSSLKVMSYTIVAQRQEN